MNNLKLYSVDFEPLNPVPSCLLIFAKTKKQATKIAYKTILHTKYIEVNLVKEEEGVVIYKSGDY